MKQFLRDIEWYTRGRTHGGGYTHAILEVFGDIQSNATLRDAYDEVIATEKPDMNWFHSEIAKAVKRGTGAQSGPVKDAPSGSLIQSYTTLI